MPTTVTLIEGPRASGKTFTLHALANAARSQGNVLMMDEPDIALFLQDPKNRMINYMGRRYDNIFLVGLRAVEVMTYFATGGVIPIPFNVRCVNLNFEEVDIAYSIPK